MNRREFEERQDLYEETKLNATNGLCPDCGADWDIIEDCFSGTNLDRELAIAIVNNCATCRDHFDYMLPIYTTLEITPIRRD